MRLALLSGIFVYPYPTSIATHGAEDAGTLASMRRFRLFNSRLAHTASGFVFFCGSDWAHQLGMYY